MQRFIGLLLLVVGEHALAQHLPARDTSDKVRDSMTQTMQDVIISSTRTGRLLKNTAITIQVVGREDIEEGTAESPANIRELLTELSGTQIQQTSAVSGNIAVRFQGLDGRYTQLLKDGFPLYGGFSGSLSILQVPPLDLHQVEVIKGAGSALYGGDAIAGIINLVTRTPDTVLHTDAIVNATDRGGTDLGLWYSRRGRRTGLTVMVSGSRQTPVDIDKDGFTDMPRVRQGSIAPTLFWYPDDSTTIRLGLNLFAEDRDGGDLQAVLHGADSLHPFLQQNRSDRDYYQFSLLRKGRHRQSWSLKNSIAYFYRSIAQRSGSGVSGFSGTEVSSFTEGSYTVTSGPHQLVTGIDLITDEFSSHGSDLGYSHVTMGAFVQDDWTLTPNVTLETGARTDRERQLYFLPRIALLYRPLDALTIRVGGGLAYKLPNVFDATDEEDAYQQVYPITPMVSAERSASGNLSIHYHGRLGEEVGFTVDQNFYYTRLDHALIPQPDSLQRGWLYYLNAPGPVVSRGSETTLRLTLDDLSLDLGYTYTDARRLYLAGDPWLPLTPRNRVVSTLSYEAEPHWRVAAEAFYTGGQVLDNGATARSFWTSDLSVQRSWGPWALLVNIENLTDTRQSRFGPIYTGTMQAPVFNEVYAPLDGRIVSLALKYSR